MKAIIIEEDRFPEILETLKYEAERMIHDVATPQRLGVPQALWEAAIGEVHHNLHYHLVRWMQGHGASTLRACPAAKKEIDDGKSPQKTTP